MSSEIDFGDLGLTAAQDTEVRAVLSQWEGQRRKLALAQMRLAAKAGGERRMLRGEEGDGGEVKFMVHPTSYHYWGQRLGYECWEDPEFVREYLRDNPEARVKSVSDRVTVMGSVERGAWSGEPKMIVSREREDLRPGRRFHKSYGELGAGSREQGAGSQKGTRP